MTTLLWYKVENLASKNYSSFIYNCEYEFLSQVNNIAEDVYSKSACKLILVAGPSSSGKTTFANLLADRLEYKGVKVHRISTDDFFRNRDEIPVLPNGKKDYDSLVAMDLPLLRDAVRAILACGEVHLPSFDFKTGLQTVNSKTIEVLENDITIIEGIHALNPEAIGTYGMESTLARGVFIRPVRTTIMQDGTIITPDELRLLRRSIRDYYTRGYTLEQTLNQWDEVLKAEKDLIYPYRDLAEYQVDSLHPYELYVYKNCFGKIIANSDNKAYSNIKKAFEQIVTKPRVAIPENSLLNEFALWGDDNKKS